MKLDVRTKLFILLCTFLIVFFSKNPYTSYISVTILFFLFCIIGEIKKGTRYGIVFLTVLLLLFLDKAYGIIIPVIPIFLIVYIFKLIPLAMAAGILNCSPSGELLAALNKLYVPQRILLPIAVVMRFSSTIRTEIKAIIDAMRIRGVVGKRGKAILHPLRTFEYVLVPMLIRSLKIADELSASAVARGIECKRKRESYYVMSMNKTDIITMVISVIVCTLLLIF